MKYTRELGIEICEKLEAELVPLGLHVALSGSLLYRGESNNDIDIIIYPHDWGHSTRELAESLFNRFKELGYTWDPDNDSRSQHYPADVLCTTDPEGRPVDFFLLTRTFT